MPIQLFDVVGREQPPAPYDQRMAAVLVRSLVNSPITPNHITGSSLALGAASALLFAYGWPNLAALLFMAAMFADHADGELARQSGRASRFGYYLDYVTGAANYTLLFLGLGIGLSHGEMGSGALALGICASLSNPIVMSVRLLNERWHGAEAVAHPRFGGFEIEDFAYLIGPVTWLGGLEWFFLVYGLGAIGYLIWQIAELLRRK